MDLALNLLMLFIKVFNLDVNDHKYGIRHKGLNRPFRCILSGFQILTAYPLKTKYPSVRFCIFVGYVFQFESFFSFCTRNGFL